MDVKHVVASCGWMWSACARAAASCACICSTCMSDGDMRSCVVRRHVHPYLPCLMLTCALECRSNAPSNPKSARPTRVSQACATHQCHTMPRASTPTLLPWSFLSHAPPCVSADLPLRLCVCDCLHVRKRVYGVGGQESMV